MDQPYYKPLYTSSWALVIGINAYQHVPQLDSARNDAEAVAETLADKLDFPSSNVTVLTDEAASRDAIKDAFLRFTRDPIGPDDRAFVFFAGHGHTERGRHGEVGYLVPADGDVEDLSSLIGWEEFTGKTADLIRAKHLLFVMDACYGGLALTRGLAPGSTRFLKAMLQRYARQVLTAGKADQPVLDSGGPLANHSVFTGHFLLAIRGEAASSDGVITANGVMSYVYEKVGKDKDSRQTPHYGFLDGDGDFIFLAPILSELEADSEIGHDVLIEVPATPADGGTAQPEPDLIDTVKTYLSDSRHRIRLDDLVTREIRRVHSLTTDESFPLGTPGVTAEEFLNRLRRYETITKDLNVLVTLLARWGAEEHLSVLSKSIARVADGLDRASGSGTWLSLRWYPVVLLLYSAGIAAVSVGNYTNLATVLTVRAHPEPRSDKRRPVVLLVVYAMLELKRAGAFEMIPDHERYHVPQSEYLFKLLQPDLDDLLFLGRGYEASFDVFEVFLALVHADLRGRESGAFGGTLGRFAWKHRSDLRQSSPLNEVLREAETRKDDWPPLKAGLFDGSYERFKHLATALGEALNRLNWL